MAAVSNRPLGKGKGSIVWSRRLPTKRSQKFWSFGASREGAVRDSLPCHRHYPLPRSELRRRRRPNITWRQKVGGSIEASKIAGHANTKITEEYTIVQLKRQDELTRRIQGRRAKAAAGEARIKAEIDAPLPVVVPVSGMTIAAAETLLDRTTRMPVLHETENQGDTKWK
jgi:hypothetical protein